MEDKVEAVDEDEEKLVDGGGPNCEHKDDADDRMLEVADDTWPEYWLTDGKLLVPFVE